MKLVPVCYKCASINVTIDAVAKWDVEAQDWTLVGTYDCCTCGDCGAEGDAILNWTLTTEEKT